MMKKFVVIFVALFSMSLPAMAAIGDVKATIDTPYVIVGMPRVLHLEVTMPEGAHVEWPGLQRNGGFPAIDVEHSEHSYMLEFGPDTRFDVDTLACSNGMVTLTQNLQFFAFDSAAMIVKPLRFVINGTDTLMTDVLALSCDQPFEVIPDDVQAMQGLKDIMDPPFVLWDYLRWVLYVLVAIALIAVIGWIVNYLIHHRRKKADEAIETPVILEPAHVVAMNALLDLEQKHLWESGRFKDFHTELTDILRHYIERRYQVQALESTTDEIMQELVELQIHQKSSYNNLKEVLMMADLVKFAKYTPDVDENKMSFLNSRLFVEQTKEMIVEKNPKTTQENSEKDISIN